DRMEPTARAREIAPLVSAAIEHIEAALNLGIGFDPAKSTAIFTAGMAEYAEVALVGRLAESFARQAAKATLRLTPVTGADIADLEIMPLALDLSVPVSMAWHRRATSEPAQVWFRSLLIEAATE